MILFFQSKFSKFVIPILFLGIFLCVASPKEARAGASLFFSPRTNTYIIGQTFSVSLNIAAAEAVNAVEGTIIYPEDKLGIQSISKAGSVVNFWVKEPVVSKNEGGIYFAGVVTNPGYEGKGAKILTINFRVKSGGEAYVNLINGSALANDGYGTQILSEIAGARFILEAKAAAPAMPSAAPPLPGKILISSPTHPDPEKWYSDANPKMMWELPAGATAMSFVLDQKAETIPAAGAEKPSAVREYKNLNDGIWYFHLRVKTKRGWGETAHFRFQIDTTPPEGFKIDFFDEKETYNTQPKVFFGTKDALSGVGRYTIKIDDGEEFNVPASAGERPFLLPTQPLGKLNLIIKAFDRANNQTISYATINILSKKIMAPAFYLEAGIIKVIIIILVSAVCMLLFLLMLRYPPRRKK